MDTTQVPQITLAKVGKKREKKKAGAWWQFGKGGINWAGATGGSGSSMFGLSLQAARAILMLAVGVAGVGAYHLGNQLGGSDKAAVAGGGSSIFDKKEGAGKAADAGAMGPSMPNSLSMVSGSLDGKTQAERDAEEAARKKAEADEAARKAAEEEAARKKAEEDAKAAQAAADAAAKAPPEAKDPPPAKDAPKAGRFGAMSNSLGGAHSGLSGGSGLFGGVGGKFGNMNAGHGKATGMDASKAAKISSKAPAHAIHNVSRSKGFRQLLNVNQKSRGSLGTNSAETMASQAGSGFTNGGDTGKSIDGAGAKNTGGAGDQPPGASGQQNSGPVNTSTGEQAPSSCGDAASCGHVDDSPWKQDLETAKSMLLAAAAALIALSIMSYMATSPFTGWMKAIVISLGALVALAGGYITYLGNKIRDAGAPTVGIMYMVTGGVTAVAGALVAFNPNQGIQGNMTVGYTASTLMTACTALLDVGMNMGGDAAASGDDAKWHKDHDGKPRDHRVANLHGGH